ncbi:MAG: hypothetical protein HY044_00105 [Candidatus Woesebacteria bacterium]|nr:MAG: hypothetical protein HY044_00105 [Candidatus Woesebacteria bacterium]
MIEPIVLYSLVFGISITCLIMAMITFSYRRLLKKFYEIWKDEEGVKNARSTANEIVNQANIAASKILADSNIFSESQKGMLSQNLDRAVNVEVSNFETMLTQIKEESRKALLTEISKVSANFSSELKEEFLKAEKDAQVYKKMMIDRVDRSINKVIMEVCQNVISKRLNIEEQDELVISELTEAKKRNAI